MRDSDSGSTRTLLLVALGLAVAVVVGSVVLVSTQRDGSVDTSGDADDADATDVASGMPPHLRGTPGAAKRARPPKSDDGEDDSEDRGGVWNRPPFDGDNPVIDEKSLRFEVDARHWEEVRRQIDDFEKNGKSIPVEILRDLMAMLSKDDLVNDAVFALSGIKKDDAAGRALAEFALSPDASVEAKKAALDALARSGQKAALPLIQQLVATPGADVEIVCKGIFALAGIGGSDAARTLLSIYRAHPSRDDRVGDIVVMALGRLKDGDAELGREIRDARTSGNKEAMQNMVLAAQIQGVAIGPEVKAELQRTVEGASSLDAFADDDTRMMVQGSAMPAAVAAGIIEPVLRVATTNGPMRDVALSALRQARGDDPAKLIVAALKRTTDETTRRELTAALGETGSFAATATLVALLDDPVVNVRNAAARGIGQIRDPAAQPAVLAHLLKSGGDYDFSVLLVGALGTIGMNASLPTLEKLAVSEEESWRLVRPFIQNAIARIKTGNPDSQLLDSAATNPNPAKPK